jgi:RNA polymerase sigma-70 factor (ECF subfamily)
MGIIRGMSDAVPASSEPNSFATQTEGKDPNFPAPRLRKEITQADRQLIARAQAGDAAAFNELIKLYQKAVFNFALRLTNDHDDAFDVSQDAFIRAFNAINSFRGDASFSTWLFRITTNVFLDERKKRRAHPVSSLDEYITLNESSVERQIEDHAPGPEEILTDKERATTLNHAIQQLPDYQRAMVVMYHLEQKAYEEIAEILQVPIGTVKSRLNRARLALKEILQANRELLDI